MEAGTGIEPVYTDLQWNSFLQVIVITYIFLPIMRCVYKCVNLCAVAKRQLCVEHHNCAYHNQVPRVKYTESYNTRIKLKLNSVSININYYNTLETLFQDR